MKKTVLTLFVSLMLIVSALAQDTLYVKNSDASTAWEGRNPYTNLQEAIDAAQAGDVIWVQEGTYYPTRTFGNNSDNRCKSFILKDNVTLYGSFLGTETSLEIRPLYSYVTSYPTILSGDFANTPDNDNDNSYHVVYASGVSDAVLDGFTITGGNANRNAYEADQKGGGAYLGTRCELRKCMIEGNTAMRHGGGVWVSSTSTLTYCGFRANTVTAVNSGGGAAFFDNRSYVGVAASGCNFMDNSCMATLTPTVSSRNGGGAISSGTNNTFEACIFEANSCTNPGGAVSCGNSNAFNYCEFYLNQASSGACIYGGTSSSLLVSNCLIYNNAATGNGGAICISGSSSRAVNCTFVNNTAAAGGAVYGSSGFTVFNCIVWNNGSDPANQLAGTSDVTCMYTAVQGVTVAGEGNLNVTTEDIDFLEPCTIMGVPTDEEELDEALYADYYIGVNSVCKDAGSLGTLYLSGYQFPDIDFDGENRVIGSAIDLGCYENFCGGEAPTFTMEFVDTTYNNNNPGTGTVSVTFTITNYDEDNDYYLDFGAGFPLTMEDGTITVSFNFPGSHDITITYTDGECEGEVETTLTLDSLFAPVGITENLRNTIRMYPVPANTTLTVESDSPVREITVYDLTGRVMMTAGNGTVETWGTASLTHTLNVSSLPAGIYLLHAVTDNGVKTARFVKD